MGPYNSIRDEREQNNIMGSIRHFGRTYGHAGSGYAHSGGTEATDGDQAES